MNENYKYFDDDMQKIMDAIKEAKASLEMEGFIVSHEEEKNLIKQFGSNEKLLLLIRKKKINEDGLITKEDLYNKKESEVIEIIENSKYKDIFNIWKNAKNIKVSKEKPENVYFVHHGAKIRYIDPLVNKKRISSISEEAKKEIDKNLSYDMNNYVYLDFNF